MIATVNDTSTITLLSHKVYKLLSMESHVIDPDHVPRTDITWVADRVPGKHDAEQANRPLELSFLQSFKGALLGDSQARETTQYLDDSNENLIHISNPSTTAFSYPLMMFSRFPDIPPEDFIQLSVDTFSTKCLPKMALLRDIPTNILLRTDRPRYLTFAMACMGALASDAPSPVIESLWWASSILVTAKLEVDNREARKVDLLNAWVILETYGILSGNKSILQRTNMTHGYIETASRRLCLFYPGSKEADRMTEQSHQNHVIEKTDRTAIPAFILVDMLRSVQFSLPPTLTTSDLLSRPSKLSNDYNAIYTNIILKSRPPPVDLRLDSAFLALIAILGEIHTLSTVFHPMVLIEDYENEDTRAKAKTGDKHLHNPFLPFSPEAESRQAYQKLQKALDLWGRYYLSRVGKDVAAFFHFCKMYLSEPGLPSLPLIVGYSSDDPRIDVIAFDESKMLDSEFSDASEALKNAWRILENMEESAELAPIWYPIVLFYAGLVVWRTINSQAESGLDGLHLSPRVLQLFKTELERMKWPCCKGMAETLEKLMTL
ncbi:hypothetical protein PVAG01_05637 [Phlyctema vagabunda]|uniref:Transcription factor domain-containing protein n=1 Tax=Phlyctema vagabunda TaxID=108571 RepID=A0ABR4PKQ6_9HELO